MTDSTKSQTSEMSENPKAENIVSYREESETQTLHIKYENWKCNTALVTDVETSEPLYHIELHVCKPNIIFKSATDESDIGSTEFRTFKSRVEVQVHGNTLELKPKRLLSLTYTYASPALQNQTLTWTVNYGWKNVSYICLDENSLPVARFKSDCWSKSLKSIGKIEFMGIRGESQATRDELLATGFTLAYQLILLH